MKYTVLIERSDIHVPVLPGCVAAGSMLDETMDLIRGATQIHLVGIVAMLRLEEDLIGDSWKALSCMEWMRRTSDDIRQQVTAHAVFEAFEDEWKS